MTILREYQVQALEAEARHRAEHPDETRLAIVMATGLGKGTIIAERARRHARSELERVLILAPTDEIVTDLAKRCELLARACDSCKGSGWQSVGMEECQGCKGQALTVGIVKAEQDEHAADIVVASVQTLLDPARRARITDVGLVLVDECEAYVAPQWRKVLEHYECFPTPAPHPMDSFPAWINRGPLTPALGFTATLERGDGASLGEVWQNVAFTRDISWGVRKGYLVQPIGHRLEIEPTGGAWNSEPGVQDVQLIDALAPEKIVEKWIELAVPLCEECRDAVDSLDDPRFLPAYCEKPDCATNDKSKIRQTVAFMPLVRSAEALRNAFMAAGVPAAVVHGTMPASQRRDVLSRYESGAIQVLVNAMVLTRGWDSPPTKCVIVGRPTKSRALFVQMAGRGLRPVPGIPVEEQDCILITVADATTDLCTVADLSDRPLPRKAQGALTAMEDEWDIGKELADPTRLWTGQVDAKQFDPLVSRSSKVWRTTKHGTPFLPISKNGEYVFVVGTSVFVRTTLTNVSDLSRKVMVQRLHKDLPDLEMAMQVAEDEAQERGGDLGKLLADKGRAWRKAVPSAEMQGRAQQLGLSKELIAIMESRAGGKAGKVSDLIAATLATRALEPMVERIKEATK